MYGIINFPFQLKTFYEFSQKLQDLVPKILNELSDKKSADVLPRTGSLGPVSAAELLDEHQVSRISIKSYSCIER